MGLTNEDALHANIFFMQFPTALNPNTKIEILSAVSWIGWGFLLKECFLDSTLKRVCCTKAVWSALWKKMKFLHRRFPRSWHGCSMEITLTLIVFVICWFFNTKSRSWTNFFPLYNTFSQRKIQTIVFQAMRYFRLQIAYRHIHSILHVISFLSQWCRATDLVFNEKTKVTAQG